MTRTRDAFGNLLGTLTELGERFAGEEWGIVAPDDVAESHRYLLHLLASGLETQLEDDPAHPAFHPIATPQARVVPFADL